MDQRIKFLVHNLPIFGGDEHQFPVARLLIGHFEFLAETHIGYASKYGGPKNE